MFKILKIISFVFPPLGAFWAIKLFLTPRKFARPESEKNWFESADKKFLKCGFAINSWGNPIHPKVLLVHGWEGRGAQLGAFSEPLVQQGYYVIALDGPAHGDSPGSQTNAGQFSNALVSVQNELGHLEAIVAHSFGGGCTVLAVEKGLKVNKIVTIASPSDYLKVVDNAFKMMKVSPASKKMAYQILEKRTGLNLNQINISNLCRNLKIPGFIVQDKQDKEVPVKNALDLNQHWPNSQLLLTKGLGHRRILKDTEVIRQVVYFIKENHG